MDAELAPFMRGEFLIFDMRLVRPKMNVSVDADGKVDWAMRPSSPFDPAQIAIEKLTITEGQVRIRHATSGRDHLISEINAEVSAKSLAGPWRADGSLRLDGMRTALGLSTGKVDEKGALRLRIKADPAIYPVAIESDGDVTHRQGRGEICRHGAYRGARRHGGRPADGEQAAPAAARPSCRRGACKRQLRARPCQAGASTNSASRPARRQSLHGRRQGLCRARRRSALFGDGDRRAGALRRGGGRRTRMRPG